MSLRGRVIALVAMALAVLLCCVLVLGSGVLSTWSLEQGLALDLPPGVADNATDLERLRQLTARLAVGIVLAIALLLLTWAGVFLALHHWILRPIAALRADVRAATRPGDHRHQIGRVGPAELGDLASDAESLRRQLVAEFDAARAAHEALLQEGPLSAAWAAHVTEPAEQTLAGLRISAFSRPGEGVIAGDWWQALELPDGRVGVVIGDVAGHGVPAALECLEARTLVANELRHGATPAQALDAARDELARTRLITIIVAVFDARSEVLTYANAGHPAALVMGPDGACAWLEPTGMLLCSLPGDIVDRDVQFPSDAAVVLMSDGLLEGFLPDGTEFGPEGLREALEAMAAPTRQDPTALLAALVATARERIAEWARDDVTIVAVARATTP